MAQTDSLELKIQSNFSAVISEIDKCIGKISEVENKIKNFGQAKSLDSLLDKTKEMQSNMENVGKKITDSTSKINQQMKPVILSLEQIQQKYKDLGKGYQFHGSTEQIEKEIAKLSNSLEKAKLRKAELESAEKTKGKMFEYAVKDVIKFQNQIDSLRNKINSLSDVKVEIPIQRWQDNTGSSAEQQTETGTAKFQQYDQQAIMDFVNNFGAKVETLRDKLSKLEIPEIRETNLEKLNRAIEKTETKLEELRVKLANGLTMGSITESEDDSKYVRLQEQIALTEKTLEALQNKKLQVESASGGGGLEQLQSKLSGITSVGARVNSALSKVRFAVSNVAKGFTSGVSKVASFTKELLKSKKASNGFSSSLGGGFKNVLKYAFGIRSLYVLFNKLRNAIKEGMNNLVQYSSATNTSVSLLKNSMTQLKNASASMVAPLLNAFAPALNQIIQLCVKAANSVNQLLSALTGQSTWTKAKTLTDDYASSLNNASKAAKGSTRAFDELNVINSNSDSGSSGTSASDMFETVEIENKFKDLASKIQSGFVEPIKKIISDFKVGDYFQAGQDVSNLVISINDFFARAIDNVDWYGIGGKIGDFLAGVDWIEVLNSVGNLIWEAINASIKLAAGAYDAAPIETVIITAIALLKWTGLGSAIFKGMSKSILSGTLFEDLGTLISGGLLEKSGITAKLADVFALTFGGAGTLSESFMAVFGTAGTAIAGIGSIIAGAITAVASFFSMWENGFSWLKEALTVVGIALTAVGAVILGAPALVAGVVAGIVAVVATIAVVVHDNWDSICEFTKELWEKVSGFFSDLWEDIVEIFTPVANWFSETVIEPVVNFFQGLWTRVKQIFEGLWIIIQAVWKIASGWFKSYVITPIINSFSPIVSKIGGFFTSLWNGIKSVWNNVSSWFNQKIITPVSNAFKTACDKIGGFFTSLWSGIKKGVAGAMNAVIGGIEKAVNGIVSGINGIIGGFNKIVTVAAKIVGADWSGVDKLSKVSLPRISAYENGGFVTPNLPNKYSLFMAGEYGVPEMLGTVGGKTAVASGTEITGISDTIRETSSEEIALLRQQNSLLQAILEKEFGISQNDIGKAAQGYANDYFKRTGREAYSF